MWLASVGAFLGNAECGRENQSTAGQGQQNSLPDAASAYVPFHFPQSPLSHEP